MSAMVRFPRSARVAVPLAVLVLGLGACAKKPTEQVAQGECRPLYGASVCAFDTMLGDSLVAFGATIPMQAVDGAPAEAPMDWPPVVEATVPLPAAVKTATGFDNITIYWEPHGHPPGPYLVPHFDFHFNTISQAQIGKIDCADSTKPAQVPAAYELPDVAIPDMGTLIGLCVPNMGMHALPTAELASTTPFEKTMIVGYYGGQPIFVEPMITRATLDARRSFSLTVPPVASLPAGVRYPTAFTAQYDSTANAFRFAFSGFGTGN
jgi:hypothetical protein